MVVRNDFLELEVLPVFGIERALFLLRGIFLPHLKVGISSKTCHSETKKNLRDGIGLGVWRLRGCGGIPAGCLGGLQWIR